MKIKAPHSYKALLGCSLLTISINQFSFYLYITRKNGNIKCFGNLKRFCGGNHQLKCLVTSLSLSSLRRTVLTVYSIGHVIFFLFSNFNIVGYFFGAFLCVEQMLENTFSSKTPFSFVNFTFKFTKGLAQKYKGKCVDLVFCFLCFKIDRNCWFCSHRSICLLDAVLLIPMLLWLMTFMSYGI